jgi:adenosylhomocysteine nucleosidase
MPSPRRLAFLFAVSQELAPVARRLQPTSALRPELPRLTTRHGALHGKELLLVAGGMGQKSAGAAADAILRTWKPDLLVMAGVAGALASDLQIGDIIAADAVTSGTDWLTPLLVPTNAAQPYRTGALLSLDHVLVTAEDKRAAVAGQPSASAPLAVEMETFAVAQVASQRDVAWAAVRAVSDTADESLPLDFNRLRTPDGDLPTSRIALAALTHPAAIPGLIRLGKNTSLAAEGLASFLEGWISEL